MSYKNENVPEELNTALLENPGGCKKKKMQFLKHKAKCLKLCFARSAGSDGVRAVGAGAARHPAHEEHGARRVMHAACRARAQGKAERSDF